MTRTPVWVILLAVVLSLPATATPALLASCPAGPEEVRTIVWCYPFYLVLSGWLAVRCWPQRPALAWVLMVLMAASTAAIWTLVETL